MTNNASTIGNDTVDKVPWDALQKPRQRNIQTPFQESSF